MGKERTRAAEAAATSTPAAGTSIGEWVPMHQLRAWKSNPQKSDPVAIMPSLEQYGWGRPIVANRHAGHEGEIIIGHHALEAARQLEARGVVIPRAVAGHAPVVWVTLPPKKAHALALADNQLGKKGETDQELLAAYVRLGELDPAEWMASGFEEKEIKALMFTPWPETERPRRASRRVLSYSVIVECESEEQQTAMLERFETEGLRCKPWVG